MLAVGETKFHGEPVAAVAAETEEAAEAAAALVRVTAKELPRADRRPGPVPRRPAGPGPGLRDGPLAHTNMLRDGTSGGGRRHGRAECVVEKTYTFPMVMHFAIEPHVFLAAPQHDGSRSGSAIQHPVPAPVRHREAPRPADLQGAGDRPDPRGAFGGKQHAKFEPAAGLPRGADGRRPGGR